jgi:hypothetical protein
MIKFLKTLFDTTMNRTNEAYNIRTLWRDYFLSPNLGSRVLGLEGCRVLRF